MENIDATLADKMQEPFLKASEKKKFGITGFQFLKNWFLEKETEMAWLISTIRPSTFAETKAEGEEFTVEIKEWIPKSQSKVFSFIDEELLFEGYEKEEAVTKIIFLKSWIFNKNKSTFLVNSKKCYVY